jgi:hypothetical protein
LAQANGTTLSAFKSWGWRIPFLLSIILLAISLYIRLRMSESRVFQRMKDEGAQSKAPLKEAFGTWRNIKLGLLALFGLLAGQAVVWYTAHFYALFYLQSILKIDEFTANVLVAWALLIGIPFLIAFASLSDRIGRKPVILAGCFLAAVTIFPLFELLTKTGNPALYRAQETTVVVVAADPAECSFQFNPTGRAKFTSSCDVAKALLARSAVRYRTEAATAGTVASVRIAGGEAVSTRDPAFAEKIGRELAAAGYPQPGDPGIVKIEIDLDDGLANFGRMFDIWSGQKLSMIAILSLLVIYGVMTYGPMGAALVELFPTRIRYSGVSLPYHIGNGWLGGLLPATSFAMVAATGDIYFGLWYPVAIAASTVVVGAILVPETHKRSLDFE